MATSVKIVTSFGKIVVTRVVRRRNFRLKFAIFLAVAIEICLVYYFFFLSNRFQFKDDSADGTYLTDDTAMKVAYITETIKCKTADDVNSRMKMQDKKSFNLLKFVALSVSTPTTGNEDCLKNSTECSLAFYLPFLVEAYRKWNYTPIIYVVGDDRPWFQPNTPLNYVRQTLLQDLALGEGNLVFLKSSMKYRKFLSVNLKIFAADLEPIVNHQNATLLVADADILPTSDIYQPTMQGHIKITNPSCCGSFDFGQFTDMPMFSTAGVSMPVPTWHFVMKYRDMSEEERVVERILQSHYSMFGYSDPYLKSTDPVKWFDDETLLSYRFAQRMMNLIDQCPRPNFGFEIIGLKTNQNTMSQRSSRSSSLALKRVESIAWPASLPGPNAIDKRFKTWTSFGHEYHLPKPGYNWHSFRYIQPLLDEILPKQGRFNTFEYWRQFSTLVYGEATVTKVDAKQFYSELAKNTSGTVNLFHPVDVDSNKANDACFSSTKTLLFLLLLLVTTS